MPTKVIKEKSVNDRIEMIKRFSHVILHYDKAFF